MFHHDFHPLRAVCLAAAIAATTPIAAAAPGRDPASSQQLGSGSGSRSGQASSDHRRTNPVRRNAVAPYARGYWDPFANMNARMWDPYGGWGWSDPMFPGAGFGVGFGGYGGSHFGGHRGGGHQGGNSGQHGGNGR
jgi:hypothetical protein